MTMTLIETKTLGADAASIEFTSIPQTYTDIVAVLSVRVSSASGAFWFRFNSSSSGYTARRLYGDGGGAYSDTNAVGSNYLFIGDVSNVNNTANTFGNGSVYVPNYSGSTTKSVSVDNVSETNATTAFQHIIAGLWDNTAAITSWAFSAYSGGNLVAGSTISLYGITKGSDGIVTTS